MDFENLTPEQKEKIKACTSPEEMLELAREEGYELTDEQLAGIAGGGFWSDPCPKFGDTRMIVHGRPEFFASPCAELRDDAVDDGRAVHLYKLLGNPCPHKCF